MFCLVMGQYKIFTTQKKGGVVKEHSHEVKS